MHGLGERDLQHARLDPLGLAIARNLVLAHGGEIQAESTVGHGTTIRFTLPLDPGSNPAMG